MKYLVLTADNNLLLMPTFVVTEGHTPVQPMHHFGGTTYLRGRKEADRFRGAVPLAGNVNLQDFSVIDENGTVFRCMASQISFSGSDANCSGIVMNSYVPENVDDIRAAVVNALSQQ